MEISTERIIEVTDLNKTFGKNETIIHVLNNFCMHADKGERVAIVGQSGAGKSTLLQILGGLDSIDSGMVVYKGKNIFDQTSDEMNRYRNKEIGFVFQFHYLLEDFTALENVMMPAIIAGRNREEAKEAAMKLLERFFLGDRYDHFPTQLSGGEQQRTALARALINEPSIILADEPTGSLDKKNSLEVLEMFDGLKEDGITVLIVTHDEEIAESCDRIIKMEKA